MPREHPLAGQDRIDLALLAGEPWIGGCPRCRAHLLDLAARSAFTPSISYETDNVVAVFGMVAAGLGVALVPALAIAASPLPAGIVARPTASGDFRTIHLVGTEGAESIPAVAATIRAIGEIDAAPWSLVEAGRAPIPHTPVAAHAR